MVIIAVSSCDNPIVPKHIEQLLFEMPEENSDKFYKLFRQYAKSSDSLKLEASYFLLENMENKYAIHYQDKDEYYQLLDYLNVNEPLTLSLDSVDKLADSWIKTNIQQIGNSTIKKDLDEVSFDMLKENIDYAFKAWEEMPWTKSIDFNEFCEYILPYRSYNEPLSSWRKFYYNKYAWLKDSLKNITDPVEACLKANDYLSNNQFLFMNALTKFPNGSALDFEKYRVGHCDPRTMWVLFVMRSIGLPVAIDHSPGYTRKPLKHTWMAVLDSTNSSVAFNGAGFGDETDASYIVPTETRSVSKVYRNTYKNQNTLINKKINDYNLLEYFPNQDFIDVSNEYKYPKTNYNFELDLEKYNGLTGEPLYLCVFGYGGNLTPVDVELPILYSTIYSFENIACNAIYVVAVIYENQLAPVSNPVTFDMLTKEIRSFSPIFQKFQNLKLHRKYSPSEGMTDFSIKMINGQLEGANNPDFSDATCFHKISENEIVPYYSEVDLPNNKSYRFYRFIPQNTTAHLADLQFTRQTTSLNDNCFVSTTFNPGKLIENTTYYWKVVPKPSMNSDQSPVWSFTTGTDVHEQEVKVSITASSSFAGHYNPENIIDGIIGLHDKGEWISNSELKPWIKLEFDEQIVLSKIVLYDRAHHLTHLIGGVLTFSDESTIDVSGVPNNGSAYEIKFKSKTISSLLLQVKESEGRDIGLSEIELFSPNGEKIFNKEKEFIPYVKAFPFPSDNGKNIRTDVKLCWEPKQNVESFDIYFGTNKLPPLVCNQVFSAIGKDEQNELKNAFDDDIRTNCNLSMNSWVGVDFGPNNGQVVNKVRYLVRNNFNIIETGNKYELFFFDQGWHSLGVQVAEKNYLNFSNVPSNTILWLHNYTQGKEERIFEYKNNEQVWW